MKRSILAMMLCLGTMSSFAYDTATEGTMYYGSNCQAYGLADGTVSISSIYLAEGQTDVEFPATIQVWENDAMTAEYVVSQVGYSEWDFWFDLNGANALAQVTSIVIPEGVTSINGSFWGATALTSLTLPSTLTAIATGYAFGGATALTSITCNAATPPTLATDVFAWSIIESAQCTVTVPAGCKEAYNQDPWTYWTGFYAAGLVIEAEVTPIESIAVDTDAANAPTYNMQGMRVGNDYRGIVIRNGKKYVNR